MTNTSKNQKPGKGEHPLPGFSLYIIPYQYSGIGGVCCFSFSGISVTTDSVVSITEATLAAF